jgi:hypothetical protein
MPGRAYAVDYADNLERATGVGPKFGTGAAGRSRSTPVTGTTVFVDSGMTTYADFPWRLTRSS